MKPNWNSLWGGGSAKQKPSQGEYGNFLELHNSTMYDGDLLKLEHTWKSLPQGMTKKESKK